MDSLTTAGISPRPSSGAGADRLTTPAAAAPPRPGVASAVLQPLGVAVRDRRLPVRRYSHAADPAPSVKPDIAEPPLLLPSLCQYRNNSALSPTILQEQSCLLPSNADTETNKLRTRKFEEGAKEQKNIRTKKVRRTCEGEATNIRTRRSGTSLVHFDTHKDARVHLRGCRRRESRGALFRSYAAAAAASHSSCPSPRPPMTEVYLRPCPAAF